MQGLPMVLRVPNRTLPVIKATFRQTHVPRLPLMAAFVVALAVLPAAAKTHPVPLDKNVDSAKCLECHEDKSKGKAVHSAIATGCLSCHEVRVNRDVTRVKLTTTTTQALCLSCHDDKKVQAGQTMHPPAVRDCVKCHDPHQSANPNQLRLATTGETGKENLCLNCHNIGLNTPKDGSRHAALDMGCDTCHVTHKNGERGKIEFAAHLKKDVPALCLGCHDAKDAALQKAHQGQPFGAANCIQCHNPHESAKPKLMQTFLHNPFENKMCDSCHQAAKDGKVVLTNADSRALCLTCHDDKGKQIETAKVQHPGAAGECVACHNPHAGKSPGFLQPDPVTACLACHSDQADQMKKAQLHQPAAVQGCATCHEPHGGENEHLLRAASPNKLCLECHGPDSKVQKLESEHLVSIFDGKVKLPELYFNKVTVLPIKYGRGHPVENHPISDVMDPSDVTKILQAMNCLSCHQPHSSAQPSLLVKDQPNNMAFCMSCHTNLVGGLDKGAAPKGQPQNAPPKGGDQPKAIQK
ncbi:Multiheme cytochrome [Candidatus Sulfotelmatobacter kueseliae]|uniref:Multiheme cytochrome n=1 Tax=Candidatus Sulfotelmatobacter kueseliae TaxID=2042962 RepID=A0A2U3KXR4_9BACT|nr:Multiheme cytochrome [Candidatus Sulfotelmatobacter kueseliae]